MRRSVHIDGSTLTPERGPQVSMERNLNQGGGADTSSDGDNDYDSVQRKIYLQGQTAISIRCRGEVWSGIRRDFIVFPFGFRILTATTYVASFILSRMH